MEAQQGVRVHVPTVSGVECTHARTYMYTLECMEPDVVVSLREQPGGAGVPHPESPP